MKKTFASLLIFGSLFCASGFALPVPKPIKGTASISSPEGFITVSGNKEFAFKFPSGWGMGDLSANPDGSGIFMLFPLNGGIGCSIEISRFDNEDLAKEALENLRKTFVSAKNITDGFEVDLKTAWYQCLTSGQQLIQTWYSVPKKTKQLAQYWEMLKQCVSVSEINQQPWKDPSQPLSPVTEVPYKGWWCHHPNNKLHILFESFPLLTCSPKEDVFASHLLKFSDYKGEGFFFVKWDQTEFEKRETYQRHLEEMLQDIKQMEKTQTIAKDPKFDLNNGYAILQGNPYTLVTVKGDEFLFGFAVKQKDTFFRYDLNDLIRRVKWLKDQ